MMTTYLCVSLVIVSLVLLLTGNLKATLIVGVAFILGGFGYRVYSGEEFRSVAADALLIVVMLPVCWWAAKEFLGIVEPKQTLDSN